MVGGRNRRIGFLKNAQATVISPQTKAMITASDQMDKSPKKPPVEFVAEGVV